MFEVTYNMLEQVTQNQLTAISSFESGSQGEKEAVERATTLVELLISADKVYNDAHDKDERRDIEKEKNAVERDKQKITWSRVGLELAKVVVPLVVSFAGYNVFQKRVIKFEETGRLTSTAGRELHLPKIFK